MKKYFSQIKIVLAVFLLGFILMDIGSHPDSKSDVQDVAAKVVKAAGTGEGVPAEERMVKRFYGINPKDYAGVILYTPKDNMDVNEILIVKLRDQSQSESVEAAIQNRLQTQLKSFEGYGAEQTALLKAHVLEVRGNYILYAVGEKTDAVQKAFLDSL